MGMSLFAPASWALKYARAQGADDIILKATEGFDGYCKDGAWLPIHVELENSGSDREVTVKVSYTNSNQGITGTSLDVSLPSGSRKRFFLYISPRGFLRDFNISLLENNKALKKINLATTCLTRENMLFGVVSDSPAQFNILNDVKPLTGFVRVAQLTTADLPDRSQAWSGLDALVISNTDTATLTPEQISALEGWLANGGRMLVTGGTRWQGTNAGLDQFLPVEIQTTRTVSDLAEIAAFVNEQSLLETGSIISVGTIRSASSTLIEQNGVPILTQRQLGFGTVYYLAADPTLQPLSDWEGMQELYSRLLAEKPPVPRWARYDNTYDYSANQALGAISELGVPSVLYICGLLGVYVLVVGPLNYIVLRVTKRRELAWITIPVLALMFTCVSYGAGMLYRGRTPILNRLVVAQAWDGVDQAYARALVGVYSPIRARYDLEAADLFMPQPFLGSNGDIQSNNDWLMEQENTSTILPDIPIEIGAMKAAAFEGNLPALELNHTLTVKVSRIAPSLSGTVTNNSDYVLHDAMLVTSSDWTRLGDINPGESKQINLSLAVNTNGPGFYTLDAMNILNLGFASTQTNIDDARRSSLLQTAVSYGYQSVQGNWGVYLMGWVDQPVLPINLQGKSAKSIDTMLYVREFTPTVKVDGDSIMLPVSMFAWESSANETSPYRSWQLPAGGYVLRFKPGIPIPFKSVKSLGVTLNSNTPNQLTVSLWDFSNHSWHTVSLPGSYTNILEPEKYVTSDGEIRMRIIGNNTGWSDISGSYITLVVNR